MDDEHETPFGVPGLARAGISNRRQNLGKPLKKT
jgi:hypothetical protein